MTDVLDIAPPARKAATFSARKFIGVLHLWVGLLLSIPISVVGLSGSLWMLGRNLPVTVASPRVLHAVAEYIAAAELAAPGAPIAAFEAPLNGKPAILRFRNGTRITVDPETMAATPVVAAPASDFMELVRKIHGHLMIDGFAGRRLVGGLGAVMIIIGLSGMVLWWPRRGQWRQAFSVDLTSGVLRAAHDLHRLLGVCMVAVFVVVCFSGVYMVFPYVLNPALGASPEVRYLSFGGPMSPPAAGQAPIEADAAVELARESVPGGILSSVLMPANAREQFRVAFSRPGDVFGAPQSAFTIDPWARRITDRRDPALYSAKDRFLVWQRALHSGSGLGMGWWLLVFISGLLPPLFAFTGVTMWWLRRKVRG